MVIYDSLLDDDEVTEEFINEEGEWEEYYPEHDLDQEYPDDDRAFPWIEWDEPEVEFVDEE